MNVIKLTGKNAVEYVQTNLLPRMDEPVRGLAIANNEVDGDGVDDVFGGRHWFCAGRRANNTATGSRVNGKGEDGRCGDCDTEIFLTTTTTTGITVAAIVDNGGIIGRWEGSGGVVMLACHGCNLLPIVY